MLKLKLSFLNLRDDPRNQDKKLRGPTLQQTPGYQKTAFVDELNENGCYIHATSTGKTKIRTELDKIESDTFPTPATYVGIGPFRLYETNQWKNASGFVFSPNAISVISYKYDFWSNRLKDRCKSGLIDFQKKTFFKAKKREEAAQLYAIYIRKNFNTLNQPTQSRFHSISKKVTVKSDINFDRAKYREMELRSSLAHRTSTSIKDMSSKFIIADLVETSSKPITKWSKHELLVELRSRINVNDEIRSLLEHALIKIELLDQKEFLQYLQNATSVEKRKMRTNFYSSFIRRNQTLGPNEHLIMPTIEEIKGVYVNVRDVEGIDHAFDIKSKLDERQKKNGITQYNPALLYHPVNKVGKSLMQVGWSRQILPWSSKGLIEFAMTGLVTAADGKRFIPQHFSILAEICCTASIKEFIGDLSKIKSSGNNLLHLAIQSNRKLDDIKLFYFWKVSPYEQNLEGKSALDLAKETHPEAFAFLREAKNWTDQQAEREKSNFLLKNLTPMDDFSHLLPNGREVGKAKFIPESGGYLVTDGRKFIDGAKIEVGHRRFITTLGKTILGVGCIKDDRHVTHRGIWQENGEIGLGYQYLSSNKAEGEAVTFIGDVAGGEVNITLSNITFARNFYIANLECSFDSGVGNKPANDSCFYLKINCEISKDQLIKFKENTGNKVFRFIEIKHIKSGIDEDINMRSINSIKYNLAYIRYHSLWRFTNNLPIILGNDELDFINKYVNETEIDNAIQESKKALKSLYKSLNNSGIALLNRKDRYGNCLFDEIEKYDLVPYKPIRTLSIKTI